MTIGIVINSGNVGRIAERIVANELEARGFRVSDLNRDGLAANADLLAVGHGKTWQVQVKGSTNQPKENWWVGYGFCTEAMINKREPMFNRKESHRTYYKADVVVFVAVRSTKDYRCFVMPAKKAESAAQINLDRYYRTPKRDGGKKKPGKVWVYLQPTPREHLRDPRQVKLYNAERKTLLTYEDAWQKLESRTVGARQKKHDPPLSPAALVEDRGES